MEGLYERYSPRIDGRVVLDFGCSWGYMLMYLHDSYRPRQTIGVDIAALWKGMKSITVGITGSWAGRCFPQGAAIGYYIDRERQRRLCLVHFGLAVSKAGAGVEDIRADI